MAPLRLSALVLVVLACACGGPPAPSVTARGEEPSALPEALLVKREIRGTFLGLPLREPFGVAVDRLGRVYVVDAGNHRLLLFDEDWNPIDDIGGFGSAPGQFDRPAFVTIDNDLNVLVSDAGNRRIARFDAKLNFVDEVLLRDEEDPLKFGEPSGVAVNSYGELWVADRTTNRVAVFDAVGRFDRFVGDFGYSGGQMSSPEKVVLTESEEFLVCDAGNARLVLYDRYGNHRRTLATDDFEYPMAAARSREGNWWVVDAAGGRILLLSPEGRLLFAAGPQLIGTDRPLRRPTDVAVDRRGRLVVSDTGNHRLLILEIIGE